MVEIQKLEQMFWILVWSSFDGCGQKTIDPRAVLLKIQSSLTALSRNKSFAQFTPWNVNFSGGFWGCSAVGALRRAVEVDFKEKDKHKSQGLYLLTTGIPDQETVSIFTAFTVLL